MNRLSELLTIFDLIYKLADIIFIQHVLDFNLLIKAQGPMTTAIVRLREEREIILLQRRK